jgi:hypothetical protein
MIKTSKLMVVVIERDGSGNQISKKISSIPQPG